MYSSLTMERRWYGGPLIQMEKNINYLKLIFILKHHGGGKGVSKEIMGPASAKSSLHYLKHVLNDNPPE